MQINGIYVITDSTLFAGRSHVEIAMAALAGGAKIIQLRDKDATAKELIQAGMEIRRLTAETGALFIVNDSLQAAIACDADGLHVGQGDIPAKDLRTDLKDKILGVSVSTIEEARQARIDGADYVGYGPVYSTSTKLDTGPVTGVGAIKIIRDACGLPVVAIGGINEGNMQEVAGSEASSAAVISAVVCAPDMAEATRRLVVLWDRGKA